MSANRLQRWCALVLLLCCNGLMRAQDGPRVRPDADTDVAWSAGPYGYDGSGNIKSIGSLQSFVYDELGRLLSGTVEGGKKQEYQYDAFGNLQRLTTDGVALTPCVDAATNRIDRPTTAAAECNAQGTYGPSGNMLSYGQSATFAYDALDMVTDATVDSVRRVYLYNASDERIASIAIAPNGGRASAEWTLRDPQGHVLRRFNEAGGTWNWSEDYIYRDGQLLAAEVPGPERTLHFHLDHLGTPRLITGSGGTEISRHTYYPFGREVATPSADNERAKFTGHERDDINLDYMHARYYLPYTGRFLSVDPHLNTKSAMAQPQRWNRYAYGANNPLKFVDFSGQDVTLFVRDNSGGGTTNLGHMAVRVFGKGYDYTFDFGRYRDTHQLVFGEGMLRVWSNWNAFLRRQSKHGSSKTVTWQTPERFDVAVTSFFAGLANSGEKTKQTTDYTEYKTPRDYSIFGTNCSTLSSEAIGSAEDATGLKLEGFDRYFRDATSPSQAWAAGTEYDSAYGPGALERMQTMDMLFSMLYSSIHQQGQRK